MQRGRTQIGRRQRGRRTRRPRILHYRWWLIVRSRRGTRVAFVCLVALLLVAVAVLRRAPAQPAPASVPVAPPPQ